MKRILFVSWYTGLGGGETDLLALADALDPQRYACHLLLPAEGQLSERWRSAGRPLHIIPYRGATTFFLPALWARFPVVNRFGDLLRREKIDIVHSDYHSLPMMAPAAKKVGVPLVFTLWGWWFKPKFWQRRFFRDLPATVARSIAIRDGFLGSPPFMPKAEIPVVYSGVDLTQFHAHGDGDRLRDEIGIPRDCPLVAMIARFQRVKGHHTFQAMAEVVARQKPDANFIVAGDDVFGVAADQRYRDQMLEAATRNPLLRDRLHYIGFRDDVEQVYAAADVVVCASEFESYGRANLEAMACGKPVVSTNRGGPLETILQGETGFLVDPDDVAGMAKAVLRLLEDENLREQIGRAGRHHVQQHFSTSAAAEAYARVFEDLLSVN